MKKIKVLKTYPHPFKDEKEAEASVQDWRIEVGSWNTKKGSKITLNQYACGNNIYKLVLTEEVYIIDDGKDGALSDCLELYPISQIKNLGQFRIVVEKTGKKSQISIPTISSENIELDKQQLKLFKILFSSKKYINSKVLLEKSGYKNTDTLRKVMRTINSKFARILNLKENNKVIVGEQNKGYMINERYRIEEKR